ncbi:unnamed protein product [Chondrus crispus]|uniref:Rab-GAP TBC domain-containing protein n=1 Tax=Chondrus crispus TaxID=2769 RepID=R7Q7G9_CHOCR|nr:unnamed protein product [Chondrus crispus]CDF33778.1 unnamed protein product [Chondrus crispus]|eukprot:XP_005713597.1 unnamed protein product [Chondrus crispus]
MLIPARVKHHIAPLMRYTTAETERLISDQELSKSKVTAHGNSATGMSRTSASQDTPPEFKGETSGSGHHSRKRIIHFSSLSVDYRRFSDKDPIAGSAQISETDMGEENDFWNIDVDLIWKPRGQTGSKTDSRAEITHRSPVEVSVDDLLTVRICVSSNPACVTIHMRGGKPFGEFLFPNGPDAAMSFITALQVHVNTSLLQDENKPGRLYVVEKRHRMRRVAPSLTSLPAEQNRLDEDFSNLLDNLSLHDPGHSPRRNARAARATRRGRTSAPDSKDFGMMLLSQFAKVTQAAREVGEDISMLLDERKRQAEADRKERERAARRRALDIYTDIVASTDVEGELPPRLCLDEKRGLPVSKQVWEQSFDDSGALSDAVVMKQAVFAGGVERNARKLIWPFLLGCYPWISTRAERNQIKVQHEEQYEALKEKWNSLHTAAKDEDVASQATIPNAETMDRRKRVRKCSSDRWSGNHPKRLCNLR